MNRRGFLGGILAAAASTPAMAGSYIVQAPKVLTPATVTEQETAKVITSTLYVPERPQLVVATEMPAKGLFSFELANYSLNMTVSQEIVEDIAFGDTVKRYYSGPTQASVSLSGYATGPLMMDQKLWSRIGHRRMRVHLELLDE